MRDIEWIKRRASRYDLVAEYVDDNTLKVHSPKFNFDSWLIVETEDSIDVMHQSKKNNIKNISYHLHYTTKKRNKIRALQRISSHNEYVAFHKGKKSINMVDRVLNRYNESRVVKCA